MSKRICAGIRQDGRPCESTATADGYCFAHSEACRQKTAAARAQGGRNSSRAVRARKAMGASHAQVLKLVENTMAGVFKGTLTPQQGSALASLAGAWVKLHEHGEMEARIAELEARAEQNGGNRWA